jgi:ribosome-binding protein aMBF1 (putative translation factor)
MTPDEFRSALTHLGWSWTDLAEHLQVDPSVPRRWRHVPPAVARWLEECLQVQRAMPKAPRNWRSAA